MSIRREPGLVLECDPPPPLEPARRTRTRHLLALFAILVLAIALRVYGISRDSLWCDELIALSDAADHPAATLPLPTDRIIADPPHLSRPGGIRSAWRVWPRMTGDSHPPLYFTLLRLWQETFGSTDAAMRSLSLVASVAAIALLFDLGRHLVDPTAALWACLIAAVAHVQIWYGQEARPYALLTMEIIGACAALVRIEYRGWNLRRGIALGACCAAAVLTHYSAAAPCAAIAAYGLLRLRGRDRLRMFAALLAAALVATASWAPFLVTQLAHFGTDYDWTTEAPAGFLPRWAARLLAAPMQLLSPPSSAMRLAASGLWLVPLFALASWRRRPGLRLPLCVMLAVLAPPALTDLFRRSWLLDIVRYYLVAAMPLYLLAAGLLAERRWGLLRHAVPAALVLYCLCSLPWVYLPHKQDWRSLATFVQQSARPGDLVVYFAPSKDWYAELGYLTVDHYATAVHPAALVLSTQGAADAPARADLVKELHQYPGQIWLFTVASDQQLRAALPGFQPTDARFAVDAGMFYRLGKAGTPQ